MLRNCSRAPKTCELGLSDRIERPIAVEHGLVSLNAVAPRFERDPYAAGGGVIGANLTRLGAFDAYIARRLDGRQIPGIRLRHAFVRHPYRGALRVDVGAGQIGLDEGAADRFRPAGASADRQARLPRQERRAQSRDARPRRTMRRDRFPNALEPQIIPASRALRRNREVSGRPSRRRLTCTSNAKIKDASATTAKTDFNQRRLLLARRKQPNRQASYRASYAEKSRSRYGSYARRRRRRPFFHRASQR